MPLRFRVLGPLEVIREGGLVLVTAAKHRTILASLALNYGLPVTIETLVDRLWDDEPPVGARSAVQVYVSRLRQILGDDHGIQTAAEGYRIDLGPDSADIVSFDALRRRARRAMDSCHPHLALTALRQAVALWRGPVLSNVPSPVLHNQVVPALIERYLQASEQRFELELRLGNHDEITAELIDITGRHPLRERLNGLLMRALYLSGRQVEALDIYRSHVRHLRAEFGLEPGERLSALHQSILTGEDVARLGVRA
jgi:DNA-binding SARP family transcriptional activator